MNATDQASARATAQLIGRLLVNELDSKTRAALQQPDTAEALLAAGLDVSSIPPQDELDAQFLDTFLIPKQGGPLVQSLWAEGNYEGQSAVAIRKLAEAAGAEFNKSAARGAAHDHLGCILLLWAEVKESMPEIAQQIAAEHLEWSLEPLDRISKSTGFYPDLAGITAAFIRTVCFADNS